MSEGVIAGPGWSTLNLRQRVRPSGFPPQSPDFEMSFGLFCHPCAPSSWGGIYCLLTLTLY
jgi:hypothetical protein